MAALKAAPGSNGSSRWKFSNLKSRFSKKRVAVPIADESTDKDDNKAAPRDSKLPIKKYARPLTGSYRRSQIWDKNLQRSTETESDTPEADKTTEASVDTDTTSSSRTTASIPGNESSTLNGSSHDDTSTSSSSDDALIFSNGAIVPYHPTAPEPLIVVNDCVSNDSSAKDSDAASFVAPTPYLVEPLNIRKSTIVLEPPPRNPKRLESCRDDTSSCYSTEFMVGASVSKEHNSVEPLIRQPQPKPRVTRKLPYGPYQPPAAAAPRHKSRDFADNRLSMASSIVALAPYIVGLRGGQTLEPCEDENEGLFNRDLRAFYPSVSHIEDVDYQRHAQASVKAVNDILSLPDRIDYVAPLRVEKHSREPPPCAPCEAEVSDYAHQLDEEFEFSEISHNAELYSNILRSINGPKRFANDRLDKALPNLPKEANLKQGKFKHLMNKMRI